MTKVTYNMCTCYLCCMSREMIEMEGRDSVKCQKPKSEDTIGTIEFDFMITRRNSK